MSEKEVGIEHRCHCHGLTVKEINDNLRKSHAREDQELKKYGPYLLVAILITGTVLAFLV